MELGVSLFPVPGGFGESEVTRAKHIGLDPVAAVSPAFEQFYSSLKQRLKLAS